MPNDRDAGQVLREWLPPTRKGQDEKPAELFDTHPLSEMMLNTENESTKSDNLVLIVNSWRSDWHKNGVQVPVHSANDLRRPIFNRVGTPGITRDLGYEIRPVKMWHDKTDHLFDDTIHCVLKAPRRFYPLYQIDDLDSAWISIVNEERECLGQLLVKEWMVESVFEAIEHLTFVKMRESIKELEVQSLEYDESAKCDICLSYEGEDDNELVFCDGCYLCVHQACYGIKSLPEGSWICRQCEAGVKSTTPCYLCPNTGGAMKMADDRTRWCHVSCALWVPEVGFGDVELMEPVTRLDSIPQARRNLICSICRSRFGAPIQCSNKKCKVAFHVTCAFQSNLIMRQELLGKDVRLVGFCPKHTRKDHQSKLQPQSPTKGVVSTLQAGGTPVKQLSQPSAPLTRKQKLLDLENNFHNLVTPKEVDQWLTTNQRRACQRRSSRQTSGTTSKSTSSALPQTCPIPADIRATILAYWRLKRRSNFNQPLISPVPLDWHQKADAVSETTKEALAQAAQAAADQRAAEAFRLVRFGLDRARLVVDMVLQRERRKLALFKRMWRITELQFKCLLEGGCKAERFTEEDVEFLRTAHVGHSVYDNGEMLAVRRLPLVKSGKGETDKGATPTDARREEVSGFCAKEFPPAVSPGAENHHLVTPVVPKFNVDCIPKHELIVPEDIKHRLRSALKVMANFESTSPPQGEHTADPIRKGVAAGFRSTAAAGLKQSSVSPDSSTSFMLSERAANLNSVENSRSGTLLLPSKRPRRGVSGGLLPVSSVPSPQLSILSKVKVIR